MRIDNPQESDFEQIRQAVQAGQTVTVQYVKPVYTPASLAFLNEQCKALGDKLCVRFYGHYFEAFDCANLRHLGAVRNLYLDCLTKASNFDTLKELKHLSELSIGIFELDDMDFLCWDNLHRLSALTLAQTRRKNLDLAPLSAYRMLDSLFIGGHTRNLAAAGQARALTRLSLNLPASAPIGFVNLLPRLDELRLLLGGRANLDEVHDFAGTSLEIVRVRGFGSFDNLKNFVKLQRLRIEDQLQLRHLDVGERLGRLETLEILNCRNLSRLDGLAHLARLRHLRLYKTRIDVDAFIEQDFPASLGTLALHTGKRGQDTIIQERLAAMGYTAREA